MDPIVSIVSGTYNRLAFLHKMVESVRRSIGIGLPYEIILVDGGSTDGTIKWCKSQSDIVLIEQKELLGAVKAFNAGARVAKGKYTILANDDIEFLDESILCAISMMEDDQLIGIGCFYQDRRGWDWHVEQMPGIVKGKQTSVFYGQVCIVQTWLGNKVGWWGDYLHTYGGDNELSCNVLEMGYKILPVPCSKIHDFTPQDTLRDKNNFVEKIEGQHPDTYKWLKKWTRNGKLGPIVKNAPVDFVQQPVLTRFFYMPIYEPGHKIQKSTKRGLRDALAKQGLVVEYDYLNDDFDRILDVACAHDAHIFIMQLHSGDVKYHSMMVELRKRHPKAIFVNWNGDYHPETLFSDAYIMLMKKFDLAGVVTTSVKEIFDTAGINWFYWQLGYEAISDKLSLQGVHKHDVLFLGNGYSKDRLDMMRELKQMKGVDLGLYGSWPSEFKADGNTLYNFDAGAKLYKSCKIAIGDSQWPQATGFVSNRIFQAMAAGAFILHQYFDGMEELLGLKDRVHLVVWHTIRDLKDKIGYYLAHANEARDIAAGGSRFVLENHSFDRRVDELMTRLHAS